jgi:hypothetical protein
MVRENAHIDNYSHSSKSTIDELQSSVEHNKMSQFMGSKGQNRQGV